MAPQPAEGPSKKIRKAQWLHPQRAHEARNLQNSLNLNDLKLDRRATGVGVQEAFMGPPQQLEASYRL